MAPVTPFARSYAHSDIRAAGMYVFGMTGMATARVISAPPPPSLPLYREKLSYHANPCAAGNTSGQRFPYGDIRYLSVSGGKKKREERKSGVSKPEIRSTVTHLHAWRIVDGTMIPNPDDTTEKRYHNLW